MEGEPFLALRVWARAEAAETFLLNPAAIATFRAGNPAEIAKRVIRSPAEKEERGVDEEVPAGREALRVQQAKPGCGRGYKGTPSYTRGQKQDAEIC